jgi:hypothetical protein
MIGAFWIAHHRKFRFINGYDSTTTQFTIPLVTSTVSLLSIGIAFLNADLAKFSWLLIIPVSLFANRN